MKNSNVEKRNKDIVNRLVKRSNEVRSIEEEIGYLELAARIECKNVTGELINDSIEKKISDIAKKIQGYSSGNNVKNEIMHIITRCYEKGGHTRLLYSMIINDNKHKHSLCVVNAEGIVVPEWLSSAVEQSGGRVYTILERNRIEKVKAITAIINKYKYIVCYFHPWDVVSAIAVSNRNKHSKAYFYNHADHVFNVGMKSMDYIIDMSEEGAYVTNMYRVSNKSVVLPIPIEFHEAAAEYSKAEVRKEYGIELEKRVILSIASEEKYKKNNIVSFDRFVDNILLDNRNVLVVVGPTKQSKRWKKHRKRYGDRLILPGILDKVNYDKIFCIADCYVDSFPMDSATCTLDAMMHHIPAFSLRIPEAYVDELQPIKCSDEECLLKRVIDCLDGEIPYDISTILSGVRRKHCVPDWKEKQQKIILTPNEEIVSGKKVFDIGEYYRYMQEIYFGKIFNINKADIVSFNKRIVIDLFFMCRKNILFGFVNLIYQRFFV